MKFEEFSQVLREIHADRRWYAKIRKRQHFFSGIESDNENIELVEELTYEEATKDRLKEYMLLFPGFPIDEFLERYPVKELSSDGNFISETGKSRSSSSITLEERIQDIGMILSRFDEKNIDPYLDRLFEKCRDNVLEHLVFSDISHSWRGSFLLLGNIIRYHLAKRADAIIEDTPIHSSTLKDIEAAGDTLELFIPHYGNQVTSSRFDVSADGSFIRIQNIHLDDESDLSELHRMIKAYRSLEKKTLEKHYQEDSAELESNLAQYFRLIKGRETIESNLFQVPDDEYVSAEIRDLGSAINRTLINKLDSVKEEESSLAKRLMDNYGIVNVVLDKYFDDVLWSGAAENSVSFVWGRVESYNKDNLIAESVKYYKDYAERVLYRGQ